jgi:ABC-type phosphate transport system ATPase subunit
VAQRLRIVDALNVAEAQEIAARDWMSDIIRLILGVEVGELLSSINQSLVSLNKLIADAVTRLTEIKNALDPVTQGQIEKLIQAALKEAVDIIKPIMADLGLVLPAISGRASSKDAADCV